MIRLGDKVKDIVTGFTGVATSRVEYLNGCMQYCVTPKVGKDNKEAEGLYFDEGQLKIVPGGIHKAPKKKKVKRKAGGPRTNAPTNYRG